jgi:hypothetical protein
MLMLCVAPDNHHPPRQALAHVSPVQALIQ